MDRGAIRSPPPSSSATFDNRLQSGGASDDTPPPKIKRISESPVRRSSASHSPVVKTEREELIGGDIMVKKCSTCANQNGVCKVHARSGKCSEWRRLGA